jgi:hypothetical protein
VNHTIVAVHDVDIDMHNHSSTSLPYYSIGDTIPHTQYTLSLTHLQPGPVVVVQASRRRPWQDHQKARRACLQRGFVAVPLAVELQSKGVISLARPETQPDQLPIEVFKLSVT